MEGFEAHRHHLFGVAYRMLGIAADAEDAVQDTFIRCTGTDWAGVRDERGFLVTTLTRLCLDRLRSAQAQRTEYFGPWLPEPIAAARIQHQPSPEAVIDARESVSYGFMVLLQRLNPVERAAFLLREVFEYSYAEVADFLGKSEPATRQTVHRAHGQLREGRARYSCDPAQQRALVGSFLAASGSGKLPALMAVLSADIRSWSDGGGRTPAASQVVAGADRVGRLVLGIAKKWLLSGSILEVNGQTAFLAAAPGGLTTLLLPVGRDGVVTELYAILNPAKLASVAPCAVGAQSAERDLRWEAGVERVSIARRRADSR